MIAGPPRCPVWCRLVTVPTDPFTTFTSPTDPFLSEWVKCQPGNTQNGGTVLPIAKLMADYESRSPISYSGFLVIVISLSHSVSKMLACDRQTDEQTDNVDHYYSWPEHCGGPANSCIKPSFRCRLWKLPKETKVEVALITIMLLDDSDN